jgi:hypothetical protein
VVVGWVRLRVRLRVARFGGGLGEDGGGWQGGAGFGFAEEGADPRAAVAAAGGEAGDRGAQAGEGLFLQGLVVVAQGGVGLAEALEHEAGDVGAEGAVGVLVLLAEVLAGDGEALGLDAGAGEVVREEVVQHVEGVEGELLGGRGVVLAGRVAEDPLADLAGVAGDVEEDQLFVGDAEVAGGLLPLALAAQDHRALEQGDDGLFLPLAREVLAAADLEELVEDLLAGGEVAGLGGVAGELGLLRVGGAGQQAEREEHGALRSSRL